MIIVHNLSKAFDGKAILSDFSAEFKEGEAICIMGPSGIGKTTLLRLLAGLEKADSGEISGLDGKKKSFIFQENRLLPWLNLYENMRFVTDDAKKIETSLKQTGLWGDRGKMPDELSGGMARRAAIARAAAFGGELFFIDEPLYGLDVKTSHDILSLIKETIQGKTAFIVTHSPEEAFFLANSILFLQQSPVSQGIIKNISDFSSPEDIKNQLL